MKQHSKVYSEGVFRWMCHVDNCSQWRLCWRLEEADVKEALNIHGMIERAIHKVSA